MEVYFSISLNGKFVFRTDTFDSGSWSDAQRAEHALLMAFSRQQGYLVTRYERPAAWTFRDL